MSKPIDQLRHRTDSLFYALDISTKPAELADEQPLHISCSPSRLRTLQTVCKLLHHGRAHRWLHMRHLIFCHWFSLVVFPRRFVLPFLLLFFFYSSTTSQIPLFQISLGRDLLAMGNGVVFHWVSSSVKKIVCRLHYIVVVDLGRFPFFNHCTVLGFDTCGAMHPQ